MTYNGGKIEIECPFCKKMGVKAFHWPRRREGKISRISNKSKMIYEIKEESYDILSDCPNCGKTKKEIEDNFNSKNILSHEERIANIKKRGLPTRIKF